MLSSKQLSGATGGLLGSDNVNVTAKLDVDRLQFDERVENAIVSVAASVKTLSNMVAKLEKPFVFVLYCSGASLLLYSLCSSVKVLFGSSFFNRRNQDKLN
jgi:hypothetical protein